MMKQQNAFSLFHFLKQLLIILYFGVGLANVRIANNKSFVLDSFALYQQKILWQYENVQRFNRLDLIIHFCIIIITNMDDHQFSQTGIELEVYQIHFFVFQTIIFFPYFAKILLGQSQKLMNYLSIDNQRPLFYHYLKKIDRHIWLIQNEIFQQ
ncbi:unnamed protein product [Paramecium pentaurelia]|uniref:Transmembrane protein n=1 Tax=Paramecium pentaurelia TaxID=43138 RepID=A0A8S1YI10_9CILI|nr:unnamed protein product [Paramecium pentaurelia]